MDARSEAEAFLQLAEQNRGGTPVSGTQAQIAIGYALLALADAIGAKDGAAKS